MNWNDWEFIWRRQKAPVGADADIERLKEAFEATHRMQARALMVRDFTEASAGVLAAAALGFFGYRMGRAGWPFVLVVALILGVAGFFILERFRARRRRVGPSATVLERVEADLAEMRRQRRLLMSVAVWYIAPIFLSEIIVVATVGARARSWELQRDPVFIGGMLLFLLIVNAWAWHINRRVVHKRIDPRLAELEKLRNELLSER